MEPPSRFPRTTRPKPALAAFAVLAAAWAFVPVILGAFTTSIGAGMAFPDWPLSNGSLNPHGWLTNLAMFAEHSHRLSVGVLTALTVALAVWLWRAEARAWLRKLGLFALALVLLQAVVGGLRVKLDSRHIAMIDTSVGRLFAMLHACLAQLFVCTLIAIAAACSRAWLERPVPVGAATRRIGRLCCALVFLQLAIGAVMRHSFAGLAIPTFPWSTPEGGLLPTLWNFRVGINFAHRVMAAVLTVALVGFALKLWFTRTVPLALRTGASALVSLLALQIFLGAQVIWTSRNPEITTAHVVTGALTLATTFWLTWMAHRDAIES